MLLGHHADFRRLWIGQTISEIGSRITREGLPLTAVLLLNASAAQMGLLSAVGSASPLFFSLAAGVVVDRQRKRPILIVTDLARAALLLTVPLAALTHWLSLSQLLLVAAVSGILTVLFDVAYQSYLPSLLPADELLEGNRKLGMSSATAEMLGPALAGTLIQIVTAPIAVFLDALSFLASAGAVLGIRQPEPPPLPKQAVPLRKELSEGLRVIWTHPMLRALLLRATSAFLAMGVVFPLYLLSAIRVVHLSTSALGLVIGLGGAGSLLGAWLSARVSERYGTGPTFFTTALLTGMAQLLIPLAAQMPQFGLLFLSCQQLFGDCVFMIYFVNETTLRQRLAPEAALGRVNAAMQLASRGMLPIGALVGGYLADQIGIPQTLWLGAGGTLLSCLWLVPLRRIAEPKAEAVS